MKISVIIPTRNRADFLADALKSLENQKYQASKFEIIVINNGSSDHTCHVLEEFSTHLSNLRYFNAIEPGLHIGRHRGLMEAEGMILAFIDDDIIAHPTWLQAIRDSFNDSSVAMLGGNNLPLFLDQPPLWLSKIWNKRRRGRKAISALSIIELNGPTRQIDPNLVWGCNFSIRKDVLLAAQGFHPDGMPPDLVRFRGDGETHVSRFVAESGMLCLFNPGASVYHKVPAERMTFAYFRQRGFNQGVSDSYTALRNQRTGRQWQANALRSLWRLTKAHLTFDRDIRKAFTEMEKGYREGFAYHQYTYRTDPEVRAWVHKPNYF